MQIQTETGVKGAVLLRLFQVFYRKKELFVKKRIVNYMDYIDRLLADDAQKMEEDYETLIRQHLIQIDFFMHERLVHLLVTLAFAIFGFMIFVALVMNFQPGLLLLFAAILVLLVPYIMHYYLLENGVQKMYGQYDEMLRRATKTTEKLGVCEKNK